MIGENWRYKTMKVKCKQKARQAETGKRKRKRKKASIEEVEKMKKQKKMWRKVHGLKKKRHLTMSSLWLIGGNVQAL